MGAFRSVPLVLLTLLASAFSITQASSQESIKIGVLTIRSGPATPVGDDILAGIETATKMNGPLLGRSVELIVEESQWNAHCGDQGHQTGSAKWSRCHIGNKHG
jgi:hypothetical protein